MTVVALIPARSGSKRLPQKNILPLAGRPLIVHTCVTARASGVLAAAYINTDSPEIAAIAAEAGVPCPVLRPAHLAADDTPTRESNLFLLDHLAQRGERYDAVMVLQPTSPLRAPEDIAEAWRLFLDNEPCEVVSVTPVSPESWTGHVRADGQLERGVCDEPLVRLNGAIYVHTWDDYVAGREARKTMAYVMPARRSVDVDTSEDLAYAEFLLSRPCADGELVECRMQN